LTYHLEPLNPTFGGRITDIDITEVFDGDTV
jgi:hypothetical protein